SRTPRAVRSRNANTLGISQIRKECRVFFESCFAHDQNSQLASMVITPHRTFPTRHFLSGRDEIPAVWSMINRMQQQALMAGARREVRFIEQSVCDHEACVSIAVGAMAVSILAQIIPEANQTLRRNHRG